MRQAQRLLVTLLLNCSILFAAGCAVTPTSPAQMVYLAEQEYAAALTLAVAYKKLPPCTNVPRPLTCSDSKILNQLRAADDAAYTLLKGAEVVVRSGGSSVDKAVLAAQQAVSAFTSLTSLLGVH